MSDLAATGCCNNDCGCGNNTGLFNGGDGMLLYVDHSSSSLLRRQRLNI